MLFFLIISYPSDRNETKRNDNFYFLSFSAFSNSFWLEMRPLWYFLIFWIFLVFFWNFQLRIELVRNGTTIFIYSLSRPFQTYFGLKRSHNRVFLFFEFFCYFFFIISYSSDRNETKRNDNFYFLYFSAFSNPFWLEMRP